MSDLHITYDEMADAATRMRSNKEDIDLKLQQCRDIVQTLINSGFRTKVASDRFDQVHLEFDHGAKQVMDNLPLLCDWLDKAVDALRGMDDELAHSLPR